jgi:hypothetical protein
MCCSQEAQLAYRWIIGRRGRRISSTSSTRSSRASAQGVLGVEARNLDASGYADGTILAVVGGRMSERQILPAQQIADRTVWTVEETKDMRRVSGTVHEHFGIVIEGFRGGRRILSCRRLVAYRGATSN